MRANIVWYAKGGDVAKSGPHRAAVQAAAAMELVGGGKPDNFAIWPEELEADDQQLPSPTTEERIRSALWTARRYSSIDGAHHKTWVIDQMVRALTGCSLDTETEEYRQWVRDTKAGDDGPETYPWDEGIAP